jgi:hypothetical protein
MMSLKLLKEWKTADILGRFHEAMYENYFGGDTLIIKNIQIKQAGDEYDLKTEIKNQWFTANELEFIERENVLDSLRSDGWDIEIQRPVNPEAEFIDVDWLFSAKRI